jgi:hypothetical protein
MAATYDHRTWAPTERALLTRTLARPVNNPLRLRLSAHAQSRRLGAGLLIGLLLVHLGLLLILFGLLLRRVVLLLGFLFGLLQHLLVQLLLGV